MHLHRNPARPARAAALGLALAGATCAAALLVPGAAMAASPGPSAATATKAAKARLVARQKAVRDRRAPSMPTGLRQTLAAKDQVTVAWSPSADNVGVAGYRVYFNGTFVKTQTATSYSRTGLACGTGYRISVSAYDSAGNRSSQASLTATTAACTVTQPPAADTQAPAAPASLTAASVTESAVTLSWPAATDNVGVTGYSVYRDGQKVADVTGTTASVSGLSCGTSYAFAVDAVDAAGNRSGQASAAIGTSACPPPPPPADVTPPQVSLSGITDGQTLSAATTVTASATDSSGIARVEFRVDGTLKATDTSAPYTTSLDPTAYASGQHQVQAAAVDPSGNTAGVVKTFQVATAAPPPATGSLVEISGTISASSLTSLINAKPAGAVTVRPAAGTTATVTGSFSPPRAQVTLDGVAFTDDVLFGPGDNGGQLLNGRAEQFNIFGADDVTIRGNVFDGNGTTANNQIWDQPAGSVPERFKIENNTFTRYYVASDPSNHSEALYVGYSADGLIAGNSFVDNGTTSHIFFTWWGSTANSATSYPRRICVRGNTYGARHGAYYDINFRAEIPLSSGIAIDPAQNASSTNPEFNRACS